MERDLTIGNETKAMLMFSIPMIIGNLLQQLYNVVDTLIVGRVLGSAPLAAVGSSYALMVFLTSITIGFCMGSGVVFARLYGAKDYFNLKTSLFNAFLAIGVMTFIINIFVYLVLEHLLMLLHIQFEALAYTKEYLSIVLSGMMFTFFYNFFASALRSIGNSLIPLLFLGVSAVTNIVLDIVFVVFLNMGVAGAAWATVAAQVLSALLITVYFFAKAPNLKPAKKNCIISPPVLKTILNYSVLTGVQQSVMNFGILMVQGLVNSFGVAVMAAFAAAVKIDTFAYMPAQDFGNAFSTFIAQNAGARQRQRIDKGVKSAVKLVVPFCICISILVVLFAEQLMLVFIQPHETEVIRIGTGYLRVEGSFYALIGCLFLLYSFYRGIGRPGMSVVLTVISLGTRVGLAYFLAGIGTIGYLGIWWAIPVGWLLADITGFMYYRRIKENMY